MSPDAKLRSHSIERSVCLQLVAAGGVVCHPEWPVPLVSRFAARILVLEPPIPVLQGQQVGKTATDSPACRARLLAYHVHELILVCQSLEPPDGRPRLTGSSLMIRR